MMNKQVELLTRHAGTPLVLTAVVVLSVLLSAPGEAVDFRKGDFFGSWDTTLSWGMQSRLEDPDLAIIGTANGGTAYSVNGDDGNLNYEKGIFSNSFKITTELEMNYKNVGAFVRVFGFYDFENEDGDRARTPLSEPALERVGSRAELRDAFIFTRFKLGKRAAELRLGDQVLSWGESTFIQGGINVINPVDVSAIRVPGAELRDALLPVGLVSANIATSLNTTLELFYQYDWEQVIIDPPGSYWSSNDFAGVGGETVFLGWGDSSDQAVLPGYNRPFLGVPRDPSVEPDGGGQYGVAFRTFLPGLNQTELGFYYMNYHSRLPVINGRTGTISGAVEAGTIGAAAPTIIGTTLFFGVPAGIQAGIAAGVSPTVATMIAGATAQGGPDAGASLAGTLATDAFGATAAYFTAYPEDIKLYGVSFNTALGTWAWQGEYSYKQDVPLQADDVELLYAALGPINSALAMFNQIGNYTGQFDTPILAYRPMDVSQFQTTFTKIFPPLMGADQGVFLFEGAVTKVHGMPSKDELRFEGPGTYVSGNAILGPATHTGKPIEAPEHFADDLSWGYRMLGRLDYNNAIAGFNLHPRFAWRQDVSGISPGPGGNFIEGVKILTLGLGASFQSTWQFDLSYTMFSGAGRYNLTNDRDFIGFNVKYSF